MFYVDNFDGFLEENVQYRFQNPPLTHFKICYAFLHRIRYVIDTLLSMKHHEPALPRQLHYFRPFRCFLDQNFPLYCFLPLQRQAVPVFLIFKKYSHTIVETIR